MVMVKVKVRLEGHNTCKSKRKITEIGVISVEYREREEKGLREKLDFEQHQVKFYPLFATIIR